MTDPLCGYFLREKTFFRLVALPSTVPSSYWVKDGGVRSYLINYANALSEENGLTGTLEECTFYLFCDAATHSFARYGPRHHSQGLCLGFFSTVKGPQVPVIMSVAA